MCENKPNDAFLSELEEIKNIINNNLLKYLKVGEFPKTEKDFYLRVYNFVHEHANEDSEAFILYEYFNNIIREYATEFANQIKDISYFEITDALIDRCNRMDILIPFLEKTFSYIDFYFVKFKKVKKLLESALEIYRNCLFIPYQKQATEEVNKLLREDRYGKKENRMKIKRLLTIMKIMDLNNPKIIKENYNNIWTGEEINEEILEQENEDKKSQENKEKEPKKSVQEYWFNLFKEDTRQFVRNKAKKDIQNSSTPEYVLEALKFLDEEKNRQSELINSRFYKRLNDIIYEEIIGKNMVELVDMDSGVKNMLENNKYEDLSNLFDLFKSYEPSLHEISRIFGAFIIKKGNELRENKEIDKDPKKIVPELIKLQKEINSLVTKCFKDNNILQKAKNKAFSDFMKADYYSKQLAFYVDYCMRIGFKGKNESDIDRTLNDIIQLFKNLSTKYVFQIESEKKMSDRLTKNVSISINSEKLFVSKLKQESDIAIVTKMKQMLSDLDKMHKEMEEYKNTPCRGSPNGIKFSVQVLTYMAWDINPNQMIKIELPKMLSSCVEDFEKYYLNKYQEQKLNWCFNLSKVEIQYLYLKNKNISISTLPQILILLELEKSGISSIKKIAEVYKCETSLIKDNIQGLIFNTSFNQKCEINKGIIIPINTESKEFKDYDEFKISKDFVCIKQKMITIPMPKRKTKEEIENEEKRSIEENTRYRNNIIKSNLVRIMKSRIGQQTTHVWLVGETSKQITLLKAQPQEIKENIESLIERNYIKRDPNNKGCYEYIA